MNCNSQYPVAKRSLKRSLKFPKNMACYQRIILKSDRIIMVDIGSNGDGGKADTCAGGQ